MSSELKEVVKKSEHILINLDLPYKLNEADKVQFKENKFVSVTLIRQAISMKYRDTMPRTDSRIWALIQDELFAEPKKLSLSKTDFKWFFDLINSCDYPGLLSSWRWTFLNHLEELNRDGVSG